MADIKISQLNTLDRVADSDVLVVNDVSVSTTKQITFGNLLQDYTKNVVDSGTGAKIAGDFTVDNELTVGGDLETTGKITFGSLQDYAEGIFISKFVDGADGIENNLTDSSIPTSLAVKNYVISQSATNIAGKLNVDSAGSQTVLYPVMVIDPDGDEDSALTDPDLSYNANTRTLTSGHHLPLADSEYNLGSASKKWKELFISGSTINLGNKTIEVRGDKINFGSATGIQVDGTDFVGGGGAAANPVATARLLPTGGQVIRYDSTGSVELGGDQSLTFKGVVGGFNGTRTFKFFVDDVEKSSQAVSIDSATYTLLDGDEPAANESKIVKLVVTGSGDSEASDFVSIFGVKDGSSGTDGVDGADGDSGTDGVSSVTTFLTNEVHTIAADSSGALTGNLSNAGGTMKVFVGATDVTGNGNVTYSNPSEDGITASIASTGIYTISSFDSAGQLDGTATFRAVVDQSLIQGATGDVTVEKTYSIAKQTGGSGLNGADGAAGEDARAVKIIANDGQVIRYDSSGSEADTLTFTAQPENQDLTTEVTYQWSVKSPGGSYVSKQNGGSTDYTLADGDEPGIEGVKVIKCEMYEDSVEKAQDTMTLYGLVNGFSITGFLTNETHTEPADSVGALTTSLSDAGGTFKVFLGTTDITTSSSVSYSNTANTGINVSIDAGGDGGASSGQYSITSFSSDATLAGTADFRATVDQALIPGASSDFIIDKKYSISKARQGVTGEGVGVPGADGTDARAVKLIPNAGQVIRYDADGTTETDTLDFTADNNDAFTGAETWEFLLKKGGGASYVSKQAASGTSTFTLADGDEPSVDSAYTLQVKAFEGGTEKANDFVTIYGLQNGAGITAFLTNESHVEGYDSDGNLVDDLTDAGGTFKVFRGTTEITTNCTFSVQSETGVDVSINSGTGVYTVNSLSADKGNADFQVSVPASLVPGGGSAMLIDKTYSIAKSRDGSSGLDGNNGAAGDDARAVKLIPTAGQVIRYDADGTTETDTLTFSADNNDAFTGAETWQFRLDPGSGTFVQKQAASGTSTFTLADGDEPGVDSSYIVQVRAYEGGVLKATDQVSIFGLQNGAGITAFLTNESHVEGYDSDGNLVDNFSDAGGTFKVFRGTTDITTNCTFSKQSQTNMTSSIVSGTGVYSVSALTAKNGNSVFRATVPQAQVPGGTSDMNIDKTYTISKSQDGSSGDDGSGGRGPGRWHIDCDSISYAAAGETDNTVPTTATGAAEAWDEGTFVGTSPGAEVDGDQAWFFEGTIANPTAQKVWIYNGSAWVEQAEAIDGNLIVAGTVTADEFATSGIVDSSANTGRTTIKNSGIVIESWETNQMVVRVKIGDLS